MKKKLLSVLLAGMMTVAMAACGGTSSGTSASSASSSQETASEEASSQEDSSTSSESAETNAEAESTDAEPAEASGEEDTAPSGDTRIFTDSTGREVELPAEITSIAVSGPLAQIAVFAIAPDKMVALANEWEDEQKEFIDEKYLSLPLLGQLYGGKDELNLEELLKVSPQVVIDVGEPKGTIVEDLDGLQEQTGVPFVHITATIDSLDETYTMLGDLLGMEEEGKALADYCKAAYDKVNDIAGSVEKAKLLYVTGEEGLNVIAKDSYHAEVIDMLSDNLAVVDEPSSRGSGNEVDMEQILNWNPDVIIFAPDSIYSTVADNSDYQTITAIKNGDYYEVPIGPYNWMGFPPSVQRVLGMQWMAKVLYPEEADYDMYEVAKEYFELFYHTELTEEQFERLTENSITKLDLAA